MLRRPELDQYGIGVKAQPHCPTQGERCAHAVADGHEPTKEDRERGVITPQVKKPAVAHQQKDEDSRARVVNVFAMHHHPLKVAFMIHDAVDQKAHAGKGEEERKVGINMRRRGPWGWWRAPEPQTVSSNRTSKTATTRLAGGEYQCSTTGHTLL